MSILATLTALAFSQTYQEPPSPIPEILDGKRSPAVLFSPDNEWMVELERPELPPIAELAEPMLRLAGLKLNPETWSPARSTSYSGARIRRVKPGAASVELTLPEGVQLGNAAWSTDGAHLAVTNKTDAGLELWVISLPSGTTQRLTGPVLNATYGAPCRWVDGESLVCKVRVGAEPPPEPSRVPVGPLVEENLGGRRPARTYTNLLASPYDEALFEHYMTSAIDRVDLSGTSTRILDPDLYTGVSPSPDGKYLLVSRMKRPFSYRVPASRFPRVMAVHDAAGSPVHEIADLPLADSIPVPFGSVRTGRRSVGWRADAGATLWFVEALDGGDAGAEAEHRDQVSLLEAPFSGEPEPLWKSELRFGGMVWGDDGLAMASEWWYTTRQERMWRIAPGHPERAPTLLVDRNYQDAYADPGSIAMRRNALGRMVAHQTPDGGSVFMTGRGASEEGVYPFLATMDVQTGKRTTIWQSGERYYERVTRILDDRGRSFLTWRQSKTDPPNLVRHRGRSQRMLTAYPDRAPQLAGVQKRLLTYQRADGVQLSATLYTPAGYDAERDGPLPMLMWAYPREHKSKATASQVTRSENTFSRPGGSSAMFVLTQGYALLDGPTMPIVGEGDAEPNDTYVEQLVASAQAAVDEVVGLGVADRDRIAIGGHSYGAFTVANLLAHSDLFRAGIARSGAYNRTLTPFGFQGEQRTYWEARDVYIEMSPFTWAAKINEPILLLHGEVDSNSGTYPVQSKRLYEALRGLGGTVRWVVLPYEDHGYRARESVGHTLWEMLRWLDTHVKAPRSE